MVPETRSSACWRMVSSQYMDLGLYSAAILRMPHALKYHDHVIMLIYRE